jgi:hypothetical protein
MNQEEIKISQPNVDVEEIKPTANMTLIQKVNLILLSLSLLWTINWVGTKYNYDFFNIFKKILGLNFPVDKILYYITYGATFLLLSEVVIVFFVAIFIGLIMYHGG